MAELHKYIPMFGNNIPDLPMYSQYAGVIVEPRCHPDLELVLRNFAYMLPNWSLYIYHSKHNEDYVKRICDYATNVHYICFTDDNIGIEEYNKLLLSTEFYHSIDAQKILVFQTDSLIRKKGIESYLQYDYVGAPFHHHMRHRNPIIIDNEYIVPVGNGGISLRTKDVMIRLLETYLPKFTTLCSQGKIGSNEDLFFMYAMHVDEDVHKCPLDVAITFSVESLFYLDPLCWHKPYAAFGDSEIGRRYWDAIKDPIL